MNKLTTCFTAIPVVAIALIFAPYLVCLPWQLTHRSDQQIGAYKIPVPFPYFITKRGETTNFWRMRTISNRSLYTSSRLEFTPRNVPLNLSAWSQLAQAEASRSHLVITQYDSDIGSTTARCQEMTQATGETNSSLVCRGSDSTTAFYFGDPRNIREVKRILTTALVTTGGPNE